MSTTTAATMSQKSLIADIDEATAANKAARIELDTLIINKATRIERDAFIIKVNAQGIALDALIIEGHAAMARASRKGMETRESKRARLFLHS